jgi:hypothetical protein
MNEFTISNKSQTDWEPIDAMEDKNIDLSDIPELTREIFARTVVSRGLNDTSNNAQLIIRTPAPGCFDLV